jgi:hypothetical protein
MTTRFAIYDIVAYEKDGVFYEFEIHEIKIDDSGIYYSGFDAGDIQVGWHLEKYLNLIY